LKDGTVYRHRPSLITIWHVDPEKDGTDDSCGWFCRARHGDQGVLKKIGEEFAFDWDPDYGGWFHKSGEPMFSASAITVGLFRKAAYIHFKKNRQKADRLIDRNLGQLLYFAENPTDSLHPMITQKYGRERSREERIDNFASTIYAYILRLDRPWHRHPRWHIHHWKIQLHPLQAVRRRWWDKCDVCGKRGFPKGISAHGDWSGKRLWHSTCDRAKAASTHPAELQQ
jgi:hypothetical protein